MSVQDRFSGVRWRIGAALAGTVGALAYIAQIIVGFQLPFWAKLVLAAAGAMLLFFSIALPNWQVGVEARARKIVLTTANEAVANYDVKVHKILLPLSGLLAKIIAARNVEECLLLQEKLKQFVVDCALEKCMA